MMSYTIHSTRNGNQEERGERCRGEGSGGVGERGVEVERKGERLTSTDHAPSLVNPVTQYKHTPTHNTACTPHTAKHTSRTGCTGQRRGRRRRRRKGHLLTHWVTVDNELWSCSPSVAS